MTLQRPVKGTRNSEPNLCTIKALDLRDTSQFGPVCFKLCAAATLSENYTDQLNVSYLFFSLMLLILHTNNKHLKLSVIHLKIFSTMFTCAICDKTFGQNISFQEHITTHSVRYEQYVTI